MSDDEQREPSVSVKLSEIYKITLSLSDLPRIFADHIKQAADKDEEQDTRLANHGTRIGDAEIRLTRLEEWRETSTKESGEQKSRKPNWAAIGSLAVAAVVLVTNYIKDLIA